MPDANLATQTSPQLAGAAHGGMRALASVAFFASGAAALAFETLWFRQASLAFGNSVWASSIVLSGFMGGMACGCVLGGRYAARARRPLYLFAALETLVAGSGLALVYVLPQLSSQLAQLSAALESLPLTLNALRMVLAFLLLSLPATAMGMSLPVLVHALLPDAETTVVREARFARLLGMLYGVNTLGAVAGALITETVLIAALGIRTTALAAAGCSLSAAGLALLASRFESAPPAVAAPAASAAGTPGRSAAWLSASFLAGFAMLGLEVVWLRFLMLFLNDTDEAFAWVLAGVLFGIALGALVAGAWSAISTAVARYSAVVAYAAAALLMLSYRAEVYLIAHYFRLDHGALAISLPLTLPAATLSGLLFTLLGAGLRRSAADAAHSASRLALSNTLGGMCGSLVAGFVLLPRLGIERSLFALCLVYALIGVGLSVASGAKRALVGTGALGCALALAFFPFGALRSVYLEASVGRWMRAGDRVLAVREGVAATFAHVVHNTRGHALFDQLATNAYSMSVNDFAARRYMKQFVYLPRALHPQLERALVIGYGIGNTVSALLADSALAHLDVVDISREALALSRELRTQPSRPGLADPRVAIHLEDGRHYLEGHAATYDLITGEPPPPIIAGVVNLYTREYFRLVRARLAPGGMASYWLPMMNLSAPAALAIIRGFCDAFSDCSLWHGSARNFLLFGSSGARGPVDEVQFGKQWQQPDTAAELSALGFELPEQLGAGFIGDASYLGELTRETPALSDDQPKRISRAGSQEERDALIWQWRDTGKARQRFEGSAWVAALWPAELRSRSAHQFENQRLINDLLFPEQTPVRQTRVLHQVLHNTRLRFPVLLLLGSDPDIQRVLAAVSADESERPEWLMDRAAAALAARDYAVARALLQRVPREALPLPDLREYIEFVSAREAR